MPTPLLSRALGTAASLDMSVSSVSVDSGDVMILMGHRVRGEVDRRALIAHVEEAGINEHMLVVRFDDSDLAMDELITAVRPSSPPDLRIAGAISAMTFVLGLLLTTAWLR